jgi:uncharacterized protein DUF6508
MIKLENFSQHVESVKPDEWGRLLFLLPEIEQTKIFGVIKGGGVSLEDGSISMPFWENSEIINKFTTAVYELELIPVFDWTSWDEGKLMLNNSSQDFNNLDLITLCKFFTLIIRADRFNEGYLTSNFENGNIAKILKAIKLKV